MNEHLKKYIEPIRNFWGKLTRKTKIIFLSALGGVVLLAVILSMILNRTQYTVLYSGLASDEAQQVMAELQKMDVDYQDRNGTIYVDSGKENSARMQLSNEGYPKSAPNYDFFTQHVGVMTTEDERSIIEKYQLQERLGSVIKTMDPVDTAYVTISLPQGSSYAWDDNQQTASASVSVRLRPGKEMQSSQVAGIKQLVSKSVPNLSTENVTVVDSSSGNEMSSSSQALPEGSLQITLSEFKLKIEKEYENNVQQKILGLLSQAYGKENISVGVKSKMDLDKKIQDIVTYTPSTSDGHGVVSRSEEEYEQTAGGASSSGGVAGAQQNTTTTTTTYPGVTVTGNVITTKDKKTYSYLVSQVEEQIQSDAAALDDLTVSVVIRSDGIDDARKQELTGIVANAAAVDPGKVAVMAVPSVESVPVVSQAEPAFAQVLPQVLARHPILFLTGGLLLLFLVLLLVLAASHRKRERQRRIMESLETEGGPPEAFQPLSPRGPGGKMPVPAEAEETPQPENRKGPGEPKKKEPGPEAPKKAGQGGKEENGTPEEPKETIEKIRRARNGKEEEIKNDLQEFSSRNPEIAAQLIRSWLKGDDSHGGK